MDPIRQEANCKKCKSGRMRFVLSIGNYSQYRCRECGKVVYKNDGTKDRKGASF